MLDIFLLTISGNCHQIITQRVITIIGRDERLISVNQINFCRPAKLIFSSASSAFCVAPGSFAFISASPFFFLFPYFARGGAHVSYRCPVTSSSSYTCRGAPMHSIPPPPPRALSYAAALPSTRLSSPIVSLFPFCDFNASQKTLLRKKIQYCCNMLSDFSITRTINYQELLFQYSPNFFPKFFFHVLFANV